MKEVLTYLNIWVHVQLRAKQTAHLVSKHYGNEVTLRGQNIPLNCCQPLKPLEWRFRPLDIVDVGSVGQRIAKLPSVKL